MILLKRKFNRFYGLIFISLILCEFVDMPYSRLVQYLLGAVFLGLLILEIFYTKKRENKFEIDSIVILAIFLILAFVFGIK